MYYLLFHLLFTQPILGPPRSKAGIYTQNNWFYLIAAARTSSGRSQLQLPSVVRLYVAISSWYYTYNKERKKYAHTYIYIYTHICLCARHLLDPGPNELRGHSSIPGLLITPLGYTLATLLPLSCPVNPTRSQRFQHI